jgi:hypothetical protein
MLVKTLLADNWETEKQTEEYHHTVRDCNLVTCGVRKWGEGGRVRQRGKGRKQTYLLCIASVPTTFVTSIQGACTAAVE